MPRKKRVPSYRLHKPSGQARVILDGQHVYLGPYGSPESQEKYARLIAERFSPAKADCQSPANDSPPSSLSINELILRYWEFAQRYYVNEGCPTKELTCMKEALRHLRAPYGSLPACDFGPLKLKTVRQQMIDADLARGVINNRINRIKRLIKWGVSEELIPPSVYEGIRAVAGLRFGRSDAKETEPVHPVADAWVEGVLSFVSPQVAAMIQLQRLTGMRPCEVVLTRVCDIDMSGEMWVFEPHSHKNRWRGHRRLVPLGPRSRAIIRPFLDRPLDAYLFSPQEAEQWRNGNRVSHSSTDRKTPIYPSELRRREKQKRARRNQKAIRAKRTRYDTDSYRRAIEYGIKKANKQLNDDQKLPHWHPNQLRRRFATEVRKKFGVEAAQVGLGHARTNVVEVYAEKNLGLAIEIATKVG
jgi:integrase